MLNEDFPRYKTHSSFTVSIYMANSITERIFDPNPGYNEAQQIAAAKKDPQQFVQLYELYLPSIYRYIFSKVGNQKDAEDLTSQVFLSAFENLNRYKHRGYFIAWLFGITKHKVNDHFRKSKIELPLSKILYLTSQEEPIADLIRYEEKEKLLLLLSKLSTTQQELIRLRFVAKLTFHQIAEILNKREDAVKKQLYRLLNQLEQKMEEYHAS